MQQGGSQWNVDGKPADEHWAEIFRNLTLIYTNAPVEQIFSIVNNTRTAEGNRMAAPT